MPASVVVIDDDPTGAQTLRDIPLLFGVDAELIREHLTQGTPLFCVLTNSRALSATAAAMANREVADIVRAADSRSMIVSRGDSTLRGHLAPEVDALVAAFTPKTDASVIRVFAPAFIEAGRTTSESVHYVSTGGRKVPVGDTAFANDARFGFSSSDLRDYLVEVGAASERARVATVSPADYRHDVDALATAFMSAAAEWVVVDAETTADIDAAAAAVRTCNERGAEVLVRCAPSMVRALAEQPSRPALADDQLRSVFGTRGGHGLVVVGSHVPQTTTQLEALQRRGGAAFIGARQDVLLGGPSGRMTLVEEIVTAIETDDVVLYTPRRELRDPTEGGDVARAFSDALCDVVDQVLQRVEPAWVIAKGGITSHEIAAKGLGIRAADVVGQLFDNQVSVIRTTAGRERSMDIPYVIFPGNVGDQEALADAVQRMRAISVTKEEEQA